MPANSPVSSRKRFGAHPGESDKDLARDTHCLLRRGHCGHRRQGRGADQFLVTPGPDRATGCGLSRSRAPCSRTRQTHCRLHFKSKRSKRPPDLCAFAFSMRRHAVRRTSLAPSPRWLDSQQWGSKARDCDCPLLWPPRWRTHSWQRSSAAAALQGAGPVATPQAARRRRGRPRSDQSARDGWRVI